MKNNIRNNIFPVSMGILWGITFGVSTHDWGNGIAVGLLWAVVFGLYEKEEDEEEKDNKKYINIDLERR